MNISKNKIKMIFLLLIILSNPLFSMEMKPNFEEKSRYLPVTEPRRKGLLILEPITYFPDNQNSFGIQNHLKRLSVLNPTDISEFTSVIQELISLRLHIEDAQLNAVVLRQYQSCREKNVMKNFIEKFKACFSKKNQNIYAFPQKIRKQIFSLKNKNDILKQSLKTLKQTQLTIWQELCRKVLVDYPQWANPEFQNNQDSEPFLPILEIERFIQKHDEFNLR